jgi:hypothetical protein
MQSMANYDGVPLSSNLYKLAMHPLITWIMLDYLESSGLKQMFDHCVRNSFMEPRFHTPYHPTSTFTYVAQYCLLQKQRLP